MQRAFEPLGSTQGAAPAPSRTSIAVLGVGRIGAVTAVGLAHLGHRVVGIDRSADRVAALARGIVAEAEPGLLSALRNARRYRRLEFSVEAAPGMFDLAFLCVDTPPLVTGEPDLSQVFAAARDAARLLRPGGILVTRSTIPVGTGDRLAAMLEREGFPRLAVVHVPEFLQEGQAWEGFREPDRVVIGAEDEESARATAALFTGLGCPLVIVSRRTAELAKYAANAFLATTISFANEIDDLCAALGLDSAPILGIVKADRRVGPRAYLSPGLGFGGHCLPKDTAALAHLALTQGVPMPQLAGTRQVNAGRNGRVAAWLRRALGSLDGRRICLLGLSFKPGTDDTRESPALNLARMLALEGAEIIGWDPHTRGPLPFVAVSADQDDAIRGADAIVVTHNWEGWRRLVPSDVAALMAGDAIFDGPGVLDHAAWAAEGLRINAMPDRAQVLEG
jgi:UDPglucose 6-dehydrogenase